MMLANTHLPPPDFGYYYRRTALMLAAMENRIITVKLLLKHGASTHGKDDQGCTALMHAVQHPEMVQILFEHGADPSVKDEEGETALMKAVLHPDSVKYLLDYGVNVQATDYKGNTALMKAIPHPDSVKYLLDYGVNVQATNNEGNTALMKAVPYPDSVKILLQHGALPWIRNKEGRNVLDLTVQYYEFPPKDISREILINGLASTIKLLMDVACDENVNHMMNDDQRDIFAIYSRFYDGGCYTDCECTFSSDDEDREVNEFMSGYHKPPFQFTYVKKGFMARLAGILSPEILTTILQKMHSKGLSLDAEPDTLSPVTSLLLARLHFTDFGTPAESLKIFLNAEVNIGQRLLKFCNRQMFKISERLQVPDSLLLALMLGK
jgi:ankyrin repeat protein